MSLILILALLLLLTTYSAFVFFIGYHFILVIPDAIPTVFSWAFLFILGYLYFIVRLLQTQFKNHLFKKIETLGAYILGFEFYFFIGILIIDVGTYSFLGHFFNRDPIRLLVVVLCTIGLLVYGRHKAKSITTNTIHVAIDKNIPNLEKLHIVLLSDLHLGNLFEKKHLTDLVNKVNALSPDMVLIPGDIIDDRIFPFKHHRMADDFLKLKAPMGVYASLGNHEYIGGFVEEAIKQFESAGINVLRDRTLKVSDSFYLIGRDERASASYLKTPRKSIDALTKDLDLNLPIIALDHQPVEINALAASGIDLLLSGHTHKGQFFPFGFFTKRLFKVDWGYKRFDNLHVIVSSGAGTWGPPIRIGTSSEIVSIHLSTQHR